MAIYTWRTLIHSITVIVIMVCTLNGCVWEVRTGPGAGNPYASGHYAGSYDTRMYPAAPYAALPAPSITCFLSNQPVYIDDTIDQSVRRGIEEYAMQVRAKLTHPHKERGRVVGLPFHRYFITAEYFDEDPPVVTVRIHVYAVNGPARDHVLTTEERAYHLKGHAGRQRHEQYGEYYSMPSRNQALFAATKIAMQPLCGHALQEQQYIGVYREIASGISINTPVLGVDIHGGIVGQPPQRYREEEVFYTPNFGHGNGGSFFRGGCTKRWGWKFDHKNYPRYFTQYEGNC